MQDYEERAADAVQREADAILADVQKMQPRAAQPIPAPTTRTSLTERRDVVRAYLQEHRDATGEAVHKALLAAGHNASLRTAYNDRDIVRAGMA